MEATMAKFEMIPEGLEGLKKTTDHVGRDSW
jgi:hypothetical protein